LEKIIYLKFGLKSLDNRLFKEYSSSVCYDDYDLITEAPKNRTRMCDIFKFLKLNCAK